MTRPADFRRFGAAFTGTRPVLRLGDPGIDAAWLRRYRLSAIGSALSFVLLPVALAVGFLSRWGPFGLIDTWQVETFGSGNVILLVILFMPLAFAPVLAAHLLPVDASTPMLLGIRQSVDPRWGPRVEEAVADTNLRLRRMTRGSQGVAVIGGVVLAFFACKGWRDAYTPHARLPVLDYARLVDPHTSLPHALRVTGAVADRSQGWIYRYSIRQDTHRDVYYPLRPAGQAATPPVALVELDQTSPQYAPAPWNEIDPPGPREGSTEPLDDWTGEQLRHAGIALARHVVVLKRQQLEGRDPEPDPLDDDIFGMLGFVGLLMGLALWWACVRASRYAAPDEPIEARRTARRPGDAKARPKRGRS